MSRHSLNVQTDSCGLSAKALRSDTKLVDLLQHLFLKICIVRIRVLCIQRTHQRFLCKKCTFVKSSSDTNTNYHRRTWVRTCSFYNLKNEILDSLKACRWLEHTDLAHILASEAFWSYSYFHLISRNDLCIDHSRCIVTCVSTAYRILDNGFSQVTFIVSAAYTFIDGII